MSSDENTASTPVGQNSYGLVAPKFSGEPEGWPTFIKSFERYRQASGLAEASQIRQISTLIYILGSKADAILTSFNLSSEESNSYETVTKKLNGYNTSAHNKIHACAKFNKLYQKHDQRADDFIADVFTAAESCAYPESIRDELIRDRLIVGIQDIKVSNSLQLDPEISLKTVIAKIKQAEEVTRQQSMIRPSTSSEQVNQIKHNVKKDYKPLKRSNEKINRPRFCGNCGRAPSHQFSMCPAKNSNCKKCLRKGHWAQMCRSQKYMNEIEQFDEQYITDDEENSSDEEKSLFLGTIEEEVEMQYDYIMKKDPWHVELRISDHNLIFKIDSGADVTAISEKQYKTLKHIPLTPAKSRLRAAGQSDLSVLGKITTEIIWKNKIIVTDIYVIKKLEEPLLGRPAIEALGLITRIQQLTKEQNEVENEFPSLFMGLGKLKGEYAIKIKQDSKAYAIPYPRRLAIPLYDPLKKELEILQKQDVIFSVDKPTDYCAGIVVRPKEDGNIRLCVDYTELNKNIQRSRFQLPSVDECLARIANAKYFSKLDANKGYFQLSLDTESRLLTTFITPFGRYAFKRMPMGIACASEVFQKKMQTLVEGIEGIACCQDDILISGKTATEHDDRLREVLTRMTKEGITLNKAKCLFKVQECTFLGHLISKEGIKPCPKKIEAILNMPTPKDVSTVRSLLGMINYHLKFLPNLATLNKPIRELLKTKDTRPNEKNTITWSENCETAFQHIKDELAKSKALALFDPKKSIRLTADASSYGLGAVIEQYEPEPKIWKPISYASRSLTTAETKYAQIDKEALALTWACEKFSMYLIGLPLFELRTDHQPLIKILGDKPISELSARMQRLRIKLSKFTYKIVHVPGKYLHTADLLSRSPLPYNVKEKSDNETDLAIISQIQALPMSDSLLDTIKKAQEKDNTCCILKEYIHQGWPYKNKAEEQIKPFYPFRGELATQNELIMRGHRILIPEVLQQDLLMRLHQGHLGIEKCRRRARESVWWPGISSQIRTLIEQCTECIQHRVNPTEPLMTSETSIHPWEKVAIDLCSVKKQEYMVVIDYYSRYPEVATLKSTTTSALITHLKVIFARFGIPRVVRSDNGPQFSSAEFSSFANNWGFTHITSSPHAHWSNGMAEAGVKIVKNIITKSSEPILGLLAYRSTPLENGFSPAQLLFGRRIRTDVPIQPERLRPECPDPKHVIQTQLKKQNRMKMYYDKHHRTRDLPELSVGTRVWDCILKSYATVKERCTEPRSYIIKSNKGGIVRRNRRHIIAAPHENAMNIEKGDDIVDIYPFDFEDHVSERHHNSRSSTSRELSERDLSRAKILRTPDPSAENTVRSPVPVTLRRSTRNRKPPHRMNL